ALARLGEAPPAEEQGGATPFAPRTVKDLVEEELFARRRDLFSELSVVFLDTTTLGFAGAGGETLGQRGYSKDHRPDLMQMILGVVVDVEGTPVCSEMWPGHTADVRVLVTVICPPPPSPPPRARHRPPGRPLPHRPGLRRRRPRHALGRHHRGPRAARAGIR